jgi:hypothetical protein
MKTKSFLLLQIAMLVTLFSAAQNQWNIVDSHAKWSVITDNQGNFDTHFIRFSEEDTLIEGQAYRKIYSTYSQFEVDWEPMDYFIREDIATRKVYMRDIDGYEGMLYDFSAELGDTVTIWNVISGPTIKYRVISVDSIYIYDALRKRYQFEFLTWPANDTWIEGIGSLDHGILYSGYYNTSPWYFLLCYKYDDILYYMDPDYSECYYPYVGQEEIIDDEAISIFPNPASSFITIHTKEGNPIEETIIYNHLGQKALVAVPVNNTVDVSGLRPGIYFIEVAAKEWRGRTKLIIK